MYQYHSVFSRTDRPENLARWRSFEMRNLGTMIEKQKKLSNRALVILRTTTPPTKLHAPAPQTASSNVEPVAIMEAAKSVALSSLNLRSMDNLACGITAKAIVRN